mmetsp:Transcript_13024/g.35052  ORF Transcript_13024/g.35052 Transcript_13024/m.35052 type:complete len:184 (+) Transcript_13024:47-598(+)
MDAAFVNGAGGRGMRGQEVAVPRSVCRRAACAVYMGKGKRSRFAPGQGPPGSAQGMPPLPEDGTPVFAIFARTQRAKVWYPVGMVGGDGKAKTLISGMKSEWGKRLYRGALDKGIAQIVYGKDAAKFLESGMRQYPQLKKYRNELEFGYKVLSTEIQDWPTTVVSKEQALPFFEWAKTKLGIK